MLITILILFNTLLFFSLGMLHFYWAVGGEWALRGAIPAAFADTFFVVKRSYKMTAATIIVALGLLGFAYVTLSHLPNITPIVPQSWLNAATLLIVIIFLARAIGNFSYCGFFSPRTGDLFSQRDHQIYTPLCFYLSITTLMIYLS